MCVAKVGVDMRRASLWPQIGISRYSRSLFSAMQALDAPDLGLFAIDVVGSDRWSQHISVGRGTPSWRRILQEQFTMARESGRLDLLHLTWNEGPISPRCPFVLTLYDMATLDGASNYTTSFRAYYNTLMRAHVKQAAAISVVSQTSMEAASARWPGRDFVVISPGVDPVFTPNSRPERTQRPSVLYTGGYDPRKRIADLVVAMVRLRRETPEVQLVMTGRAPDHILQHALSALTQDGLVQTGFVSDQDLAAWYRKAWVVAYPTDLEGFGFPLVEAFASGTPVVATTGGSVAEVAGDAAVLIAPRDIDALVEALDHTLFDDTSRARMRAAGLARAQHFQWPNAARRTLDLYRSVLG